MARDAACLEDGFDFLREMDGMTGRGRQLRGPLGRDRGSGSGATACPNDQPHVKKAVWHPGKKVMETREKDSGNLIQNEVGH
jgi:hypothetical protein